MEEAAQILEIETFIPLLLQVSEMLTCFDLILTEKLFSQNLPGFVIVTGLCSLIFTSVPFSNWLFPLRFS